VASPTVVVCGLDRFGLAVVNELVRRGAGVFVVAPAEQLTRYEVELDRLGVRRTSGAAHSEGVLVQAGLERATALVLTADDVADNIDAAIEMDKRGVCASVTYIIGYPHEDAGSMLATIDQCRRLHVACPLARPTVWPYRPIPGTAMWDQAIGLGYEPPQSLPEWGSIGEYHLEETWPGKIPQSVMRMRNLYQHYVTLSYGLARGKIGWWERRAERRLRENDFRLGKLEARAFDVFNRIEKKLFPRVELSRSWVDPGHKTGTGASKASKTSRAMTETTVG